MKITVQYETYKYLNVYDSGAIIVHITNSADFSASQRFAYSNKAKAFYRNFCNAKKAALLYIKGAEDMFNIMNEQFFLAGDDVKTLKETTKNPEQQRKEYEEVP